MKATYIPTCFPKNLEGKDIRRSLPPENLAACLARYSRSNQGIETILEQYADKTPDAIFKFIDYGHASIGGLTGSIAIAIDDVSMLLALKLFEFSQMADGQESSTRYIVLDKTNIVEPDVLGLGKQSQKVLEKAISLGFELYFDCLQSLEEKIEKSPELARIPIGTPDKVSARMRKNYGLDRVRYFLPIASKTNLALCMSARMWAETLRSLRSLPWPEAQKLGTLISKELSLASPNLLRHSLPDLASKTQSENLLRDWRQQTLQSQCPTGQKDCKTQVETFNPLGKLNLNLNPNLNPNPNPNPNPTRTSEFKAEGKTPKSETLSMP